MIRISNIKIKPDGNEKALYKSAAKQLSIREDEIKSLSIIKRSLDARRRPDIFYIYTVDVTLKNSGKESAILSKNRHVNISRADNERYIFPYSRADFAGVPCQRPVIVGFGPAGMFAALMLARCGLEPLVIERGQCVEERKETVERFWLGGGLDTQSNVQFGEGGAGTFSDGKLNTSVKDTAHRMKEVLRTFAEFGADPSVVYVNKPHIGTDVLCNVVRNIRSKIISLGGEIRFNTCLEDFEQNNEKICSITIRNVRTDKTQKISTDCLILAIGHSARDTFKMLYDKKVNMTPKAFAVGLRIEHPQKLIDINAYGDTKYALPAADYKLTYKTKDQRGVYSFCMCPGGYVVNASSEENMTAVNGMSYSGRNGINANSAIIVTVNPADYAGYGDYAGLTADSFGTNTPDGVNAPNFINPLAGVEFQRCLEKIAYRNGGGLVPVQLAADFKADRASTGIGCVVPQIKGGYRPADVRGILPRFVGDAIAESMGEFERYIHGYDMEEAVFSGVESRTSSPLRIVRDNDTYESNVLGLYPCGEGAGYAGGITSAAMDGIRTAEKAAKALLKS